MNGSFTILGVLAISMVAVSYLAYKMTVQSIEFRPDNDGHSVEELSLNNSTLEEDLQDILRFVPVTGIKEILYNYLMYDKQIANTYSFINDQKKFIIEELKKMPHTGYLAGYLREMGFNIEYWQSEVSTFWKNLPRFERYEPTIAAGGLTVMVQKMLQLLPNEEIHILLWAKARYSENFRFFILLLGSPMFVDMCKEMGENSVLLRHYYWAIDADIEALFAVELFCALHTYLTQIII